MAQRCQLIQPAPLQLSLRILQQQRYGTVKSTGKYFPFTTFRQLIAHTRLTFSFLSLRAAACGAHSVIAHDATAMFFAAGMLSPTVDVKQWMRLLMGTYVERRWVS